MIMTLMLANRQETTGLRHCGDILHDGYDHRELTADHLAVIWDVDHKGVAVS